MSLQPVNYRPRYSNYSLLSDASLCSASIGITSEANPALNTLSLRGGIYTSPVGGSFAALIGSALEEELGSARLPSPAAPRTIDIVLTENHMDAGLGTGKGHISATFSVRPASSVSIFSKSLSADREWPSAFYGMTAMEQARIQHSELIADLLHQLFSDSQFIESMRCGRSISQ